MISRYIPATIRKALREEVGFGCPICRSPFLEYHHFNPTWAESKKHIPSGMIALCPAHHRKAHGDTWSKEDLTKLKSQFTNQAIKGDIDWSIKNCFFYIGNNLIHGDNGIALTMNGKPIFSLQKDTSENFRINALVSTKSNKNILKIENNDIFADPSLLDDLNCTTSSNSISIKALDSSLTLAFSRPTMSVQWLKKANLDVHVFTPVIQEWFGKEIQVINIEGAFKYDDYDIGINDTGIDLDFRKSKLDRANLNNQLITANGAILINIGNHLAFSISCL